MSYFLIQSKNIYKFSKNSMLSNCANVVVDDQKVADIIKVS